jgi:hypothetical protein
MGPRFLCGRETPYRSVRRTLDSGSIVASLHRKRLGRQGGGEDVHPSRGVFDKETRRKPLAFAADAYGISMPLLHTSSDGYLGHWRIRLQSFGRLASAMAFWR